MASFDLKVGGSYKTNDGEIVTITSQNDHSTFMFDGSNGIHYSKWGLCDSPNDMHLDIKEEITGGGDKLWVFDAFTVTPVRLELMMLAKQRSEARMEIRESTSGDIPALEILGDEHTDLTGFYAEFERLEEIVKTPLNEPILPDDYPVYQGYMYVANGRPVEFIDGMNMTVGRWKALRIPGVDPVTEVRRCDIIGRQMRLPPKPPEVPRTQQPGHWNASGKTINQVRRKPRSSHKIKKIK